MSNDYGSGYRDGKRYAQFEVHIDIQKKQKEIDLLVEALMHEKREITRLREALHEIMAVPNSEAAPGIMKVIAKHALGEEK